MSRIRQLIRVQEKSDNSVGIVIPGWDHRRVVRLSRDAIPFDVQEGQRLHAVVDLDAEDERMLFPTDWESK